MTYTITGLDPAPFAALLGASDAELAAIGAIRVTAMADRGYPCRISLADARAGETLILLNHVTHAVETPYRTAYAIYVRDGAEPAPRYIDEAPPFFAHRTLGLRGFGADAMLKAASVAGPGEADAAIRALFADPAIAYIQAHNAAAGCFLAQIDRAEEGDFA
jgi:hypothetical protein